MRLQLEHELQQALQVTVDVAEGIAKERANEHWETDSGSAVLSITGYNPEVERYDKNFGDWEYARDADYESPRHGNRARNFDPQRAIRQASREGDYEAYLTMFVHYAPKIDADQLLEEASDDSRGTFVRQVVLAVQRALV